MNKMKRTEDRGGDTAAYEGSAERESTTRRSNKYQTIQGSVRSGRGGESQESHMSPPGVQDEMSAGGTKSDNKSLVNIPL